MRRIGFSTGAIARGNFRAALSVLRFHNVDAVELSALRLEELEPLIEALPSLDLHQFSYVSFHAPSWFPPESEEWVLEQLKTVAARHFPIIVHPDAIANPDRWQDLGSNLTIENMDKRKPIGRNVKELRAVFERLPLAKFCFDIGHARQVDPTMTEAALLLRAFGDRLVEVHMSEVNTASRHDPISQNAVMAFSRVAGFIQEDIPIILEALIDQGQSDIGTELRRVLEVFSAVPA